MRHSTYIRCHECWSVSQSVGWPGKPANNDILFHHFLYSLAYLYSVVHSFIFLFVYFSFIKNVLSFISNRRGACIGHGFFSLTQWWNSFIQRNKRKWWKLSLLAIFKAGCVIYTEPIWSFLFIWVLCDTRTYYPSRSKNPEKFSRLSSPPSSHSSQNLQFPSHLEPVLWFSYLKYRF